MLDTCRIRMNMPLWVTAPEQEQVIKRPPLFVSCMANEFKFLYIPDAPCRTCSKKHFTLKFQFHDKKLKVENEQKQQCIANFKTFVITPEHNKFQDLHSCNRF